AATDPTPGAIMRASSPKVMEWVQRMVSPKAEGPFEAWSALAPTLMPLLKDEVAALFLPWTVANAAAIERGDKNFEMTLGGAAWSQEPQKYHARALAEIRRKYAAAKNAPGLEAILDESGCLKYLVS
ncbi:MAG TPA: glutathione S-transferase family protein, partial [Reyranella sp.]|nr:glutathione S-transferase family protein [Reyranella sp.]